MNFKINVLRALIKTIPIAILLIGSQVAEASALLSDDFNPATSEGASPTWRFYDPYDTDGILGNESGESTQIFDGTNAITSIPSGLTHDLWTSNTKAPRLLQNAPNTDFKFEVKFDSAPKFDTQLQGIIIQENDNVFLRFDIYHDGSGVKLYIAYVNVNTNEFTPLSSSSLTNFPKYRQIHRSGDNWTFRYSTNGTDWTDVNFNKNLSVSEVGVYAGTSRNNPEFISSIDYFIDLDDESPSIDIDTWVPPASSSSAPVISTWYAQPSIQFGQAGIPQKWANILGNVSSDIDIVALSYKVNNTAEQPLYFAKPNRNDYRLENEGDFNIEIDHNSLQVGANLVGITATDSSGQETTRAVTINYTPDEVAAGSPSSYTLDWGSIQTIQEVESISHIVDGLWGLTPAGIKTIEPGYDRAIAVGDISWQSDNHEVTVSFIPHGSFAGIGFGVGWQGHTVHNHPSTVSLSPRAGWPVQAIGWISGSSTPKLQIIKYTDEVSTNNWAKPVLAEKSISRLITNEKYVLKSYSESIGNGKSKFHLKFWKDGDGEPDNWDIEADVPTQNGSILLFSWRGDMTFGNVSVIERNSTTPPTTDNPPNSEATYQLPDNEWRQISLPLNPGANNKVSDIFGADGLGIYGTDWTMYRFDTSSNSYVDLGENGILRQGEGYWIVQVTGVTKTLDMPAGSTQALTTTCSIGNCVEIPLATKETTNQWNMVGYPFNASGHLNNTQIVTTAAPCASGCSMDVAETNNISQQLLAYNGTDYVTIDTTNDNLNPWQGFWLTTLSSADGKNPSLVISKP